jgi:carbonic anhydrase
VDLIYRYDPYQPVRLEAPPDAAAALQLLCDGNHRMTSMLTRMQKVTLGETVESEIVVPICPVSLGLPLWQGAIATQKPYALFLGCSDARAPIEPLFDQAFNDLFVVRIAGNVLGTECLGSIDYAVRHFPDSLKLVVVLGHSGCGAVSAAVETYLSPKDYADIAFTHALRSLVDRIMIAVRGAARALERVCGRNVSQHPMYKDALKELTVYLNAAITAFDLRRVVAAHGNESIRVVYGVCDIGSLYVNAVPTAQPTCTTFGDAPGEADELTNVAMTLVQALLAKGALGNRLDLWNRIV